MDYFPIFLDIKGKRCLVIGGGTVASRKASMLLRAHASIHVVAPEIDTAFQEKISLAQASFRMGCYQESDLDGVQIVIAATDDRALNQQVSQDCKKRNIPVNVVDNPALCTFILPSVIDRSPLVITICSSGKSPVLARQLRTKLESIIPAGYGNLAKLSGELRGKVKKSIPNISARRAFWEKHLQGRFADLVFSRREEEARALLEQSLESADSLPTGEVYLVGAGPGDPDLLTFRALRLMQQADVVVHDRLVSKEILDLCRRDAELIYVGKARANHAVPQEDINRLLVTLAQQGQRVCRLKGGDPFVFGRGGEEIQELAEAGIPFQVVPGITAANGCAAYAGIPLTHRDYAQSVRFVTGHLKDDAPELPWHELVQTRQTLVFYMGLIGLEEICRQLVSHGMASDMPVALVSHGTTAQQQVVTGTLNDIADKVKDSGVRAPTLTIIGGVVALRDKLKWFEEADSH